MEKKVISVSHAIDAAAAHHAAREVAASCGFGKQASEEIAIAVSELASNLVKHAHGGILIIEPLPGDRPGIQMEAQDNGPGIANIEQAMVDGFSTAGGLGLGLGTINRFMETLEINSQPGQGTRIVCKRWLHAETRRNLPSPLDIGVASRPHLGIEMNGDTFVIKQSSENALVGVIDGLGHGQLASLAAQTARNYVETHSEQPLRELFLGTGRACLATRGVVMALARFHIGSQPPEDIYNNQASPASVKFSFASLGNIEARLLGSHEPADFMTRRGIVGLNAPNAVVTEHLWNKNCVLILHSDGLTTHWQPADFPSITRASATLVAQELLRSLAKDADDATVIVVKAAAEE